MERGECLRSRCFLASSGFSRRRLSETRLVHARRASCFAVLVDTWLAPGAVVGARVVGLAAFGAAFLCLAPLVITTDASVAGLSAVTRAALGTAHAVRLHIIIHTCILRDCIALGQGGVHESTCQGPVPRRVSCERDIARGPYMRRFELSHVIRDSRRQREVRKRPAPLV